MSGGGKSSPSIPDPYRQASDQSQWNSYTAQLQQYMNMMNQNSPWGSMSYSQTGTRTITDPSGNQIEVPMYTAETRLSPEQQRIFDASQGAQGSIAELAQRQAERLGDTLSDPFSFNNQDAENWSWDLASQRILPQQGKAREELETRLMNRGIRPGSAAYDQEMQRLEQGNTDQMNQLALQGRSQAFGEQLNSRNQRINEVMGLLGGGQVQNPNATFAQTPQTGVGGVDFSGLQNQYYQNQLGRYNSNMGALGGLFGSIARMAPYMFSDERVKTDIKKVGSTFGGTPIYKYRYNGDKTVRYGVIAQEVEKDQPDAVRTDPVTGLKAVDYDKVR